MSGTGRGGFPGGRGLALFLICAGYVLAVMAAHVELLYDELTYVVGGATALRNFATLTFDPQFWSFEFHPPFMMYFYGGAFATYVLANVLAGGGAVGSMADLAVSAAQLLKSDAAVFAFRLPSIAAALVTLFVTWRFGERVLGSRRAGLCAALLLVLLPPFAGMGAVAYLEIGMVATQAVAAYLFMTALIDGSWRRYFLSAVFVGFSAGTKLFSGSIGFVIAFYMAFLAWWYVRDNGRNAALLWLRGHPLALAWFPISPLVLYAVWPWLWTDPTLFLKNLAVQFTIVGHGFYLGTAELGPDYYFVYLAVCAPIAFLAAAGWGALATHRERPREFWFFALWILFTFGIITLSKGKHGGYRHIMPAFVPLAVMGGYGVDRLLTWARDTARPVAQALSVFAVTVGAAWIVYANVSVFPHQKDYFNEFVGGPAGAMEDFIVADSGVGQREAIEYVDSVAPEGATVWVWGTKPNAFMYSRRVNVRRSLADGVVFTARNKEGMAQNESIYPLEGFGNGDLTFRFPYFDETSQEMDFSLLAESGATHVVVHRLFTYPGMFPGRGQSELLREIEARYKPVRTFSVLGVPTAWVYDLRTADGVAAKRMSAGADGEGDDNG
ncbi:4-amino-4-deoxy-L-arabinose transferase-like glycosyltransferase [Desulfobaculum xiamenense]|uniref:4-amino-4-deoxy-L-arabinose transferase-like glycosyltransferase n=1 Tax=Desulfobaculum xiamenense TaxID=995050 RepID=A0A846QVL2_9BACT|nr:glycosyltransferase family 39 protein [Desulfobaculum xiamenense]NJB68679.1 4-amino-4-deoxy-L-arabinose transferase-like glycosyltransferase [Desulfobaculum xiamenense]